jgi:hypothetical protein
MDREILEVHVLPLKSDEFPASQSLKASNSAAVRRFRHFR